MRSAKLILEERDGMDRAVDLRTEICSSIEDFVVYETIIVQAMNTQKKPV